MLQLAKTVTLTGVWTRVEFSRPCRKWCVKNFSDADLLVSFEPNTPDDECIRILPNSYEEPIQASDIEVQNFLYLKGTGKVEVENEWYVNE